MKAPAEHRTAHLRQSNGCLARPAAPVKNAIGLALLLGLTCGCSTFNRDWRTATQESHAPASIAGRWEGRWLSEVNGHTGELRGLLKQTYDDQWSAQFRATYWKVFRFSSSVELTVKPHEGGWRFTGEKNLGKLAGGVYQYEGNATSTDFSATYRSKYDHGIFEMQRPE
ncbi:MAG: hypothetical protein IH623_15575 [Verrucomicrobia bacterium]|nr:hypothetical protein [Verrucomicrobiota bacterium]